MAARSVPESAGEITVRSPNLAASWARRSGCATVRSSPVSPTSPKQASGEGSVAVPRAALATASATARSAPGSATATPPTAVTKTAPGGQPEPRPVAVDAVPRPARGHDLALGDERLDLDQERARALHRREDDRAGRL